MPIIEDMKRIAASLIAWIRRSDRNAWTVYLCGLIIGILALYIDASSPYRPPWDRFVYIISRIASLHLAILFLFAFYRYIKWAKKTLVSEEHRVNTMRRDTMNAIAHEVRTPLAALLGYTENLKLGVREDKKEYYLEQIEEKGHEINRMIDEILSLSRLEDADFTIHLEILSMNSLIAQLIKEHADSFEIIEKGEWFIEADREYIVRMLKCLLDNALKYRSPGTAVKITINHFSLLIHNCCEPLDAEKLSHIFEFQPKADGHYSFGLYYCHKAAEKNGLKLRIYNETDGVTVSMY